MSLNIHSIAPTKVVKGERAWNKSIELIAKISNRPLIIGRSISTKKLRISFKNDLLLKCIQAISF